jgi:hypothetical protein
VPPASSVLTPSLCAPREGAAVAHPSQERHGALLIAYAAGQLATLLPITPGGLGVTEGSMAVTLAAYGGGMAAAVAAVLLYRLITYWAVLPAGGICYLSLRRRHSLVIPAPAPGLHEHPRLVR